MSRRALGNKHNSQFSTNQSIVAEFGWALCLQATKRLICRKVCFKRLTKFQEKKKSLIDLQDFYQDWLALFNLHRYDEFHVPDVLIVSLYM